MGVEMQWVDGVSAALLQRSPFIGRLWRARQHIIVLQREVAELKQRLEALEQHIADLRRGSSPAEAGPCVELLAESREAPQPQSVLTIPYRDVPIFINSFNRVNCLRQLIQWLQTHGYRRIFVIDNASTYPPLLVYYETIEKAGVTVIRLCENVGSLALWEREVLHTVGVSSEFVYTDPDVVPAESCPGTVVQHLQRLLNQYPEVPKIGLGLRLASIPTHFRHRAEALRWEAQFWRRPVAPGLMAAEVDTTFALYRPGSAHELGNANNLRTTYPYLAEHLGWHVNSEHPSEEDICYATTARMDVTNWNGITGLGRMGEALNNVRDARLMHLGCGKDVFPGWLNVDLQPTESVLSVDLDALGDAFADLPESSFDGFYGAIYSSICRTA